MIFNKIKWAFTFVHLVHFGPIQGLKVKGQVSIEGEQKPRPFLAEDGQGLEVGPEGLWILFRHTPGSFQLGAQAQGSIAHATLPWDA